MRTSREIKEEKHSGITYDDYFALQQKNILEVLCDIRLFLANLTHGEGYGEDYVLEQAADLIQKSSEEAKEKTEGEK